MLDLPSRYVRVSAATVRPKPDVGVPSMTRGLRTASVVCHDTTTSVPALLPNCRCRPPTGGVPLRSGWYQTAGPRGGEWCDHTSTAPPPIPAPRAAETALVVN